MTRAASLGSEELAQDELKDPAVAEVLGLARRIDPDPGREACGSGLDAHFFGAVPGVEGCGETGDVELLLAGQAERLHALPRGQLQREHTHSDEVGAMNALEALGDDGAYAQQHRALRRPVARGARPVLAPA